MVRMKIQLRSLLICAFVLLNIIPGITNANTLQHISTSSITLPADVSQTRDLIKITDETPTCDLGIDSVVYGEGGYLSIYHIQTGETQDIPVGGNIIFPKISGARIVYYDFVYMGFKMYDITTEQITPLIVTNWSGGESDSFQFFGDSIVYENYETDMYSTEIYLYNITTSENIQLTNTPGEDYPENPCIYNNIVAWQLTEGNICDIVMYNIDTEEYTRVTNTSQYASETFPSIYENTIVYNYFYYDKINGTILYALKTYDISTAEETTVFSNEEPTASTPEIYGTMVAYSVPSIRLCLYDLSTHDETTIYETSDLVQPWNLNDQYVVFTVLGEGVYLYQYQTTPSGVEIEDITGGILKVHAGIKNIGSAVITNVTWSISLSGGFIVLGKDSAGTIPSIEPGATVDISSNLILGIGKTIITITADTATKTQNATLLLVFIKT
jgi:hypothetical protein